ncbi:MAG: ubiquitin carboxyl-terminal hydrolase, partial [Puniceicoccales bacterium]|nr:ubiquitin carboxyl-terminal hydrolase [Puniceicoccales bacterium]
MATRPIPPLTPLARPIINSEYSPSFIGLSNYGNTCFANSSLQFLYSIPSFRNGILQYN